MAAARGLHEGLVDVPVLFQEIVAGQRHADHRVQRRRLVEPLHGPAPEVVEQLVHDQLGLADDHGIAMGQGLARHETGMHAPHDHGNASGAKGIGDIVAAIDIAGHRGNADEVGLQVKVDGLDVLVGEHDLVVFARNAGCNGKQTRERRIKRPIQINRARRQ